MKPVRIDHALARRAAAIEVKVNKATAPSKLVAAKADWLINTYGASQRLADNVRKGSPEDFYNAVADEIEGRIK